MKHTNSIKRVSQLGRGLLVLLISLFSGINSFAQAAEESYTYVPPKSGPSLTHGPLAIIFFSVVTIGIFYAIYHYWSNGKLIDDMADDGHIRHHQ